MKKDSRKKGDLASKKRQKLFDQLLKDRGIDLPPVPKIPKRDASGPCPLSFTQERLWKEWRAAPLGEIRHEAVLLRLLGQLNVEALVQALNEVVRRHEILRTRFVEVDGEPSQVASEQLKFIVSIVDLSHLSESERDAKYRLLAQHEFSQPFDLEQGPLIRCGLIHLGMEEKLLMVTAHQIVCDGWSRKILVRDLGRFYGAYNKGEQPELSELEIQYGDYAYWERSRVRADQPDQKMAEWKRKLLDKLPLSSLSPDPLPSVARGGKVSRCEVNLSRQVSERIMQVIRSQDITAFMVFLAAWQVLVGQTTDREALAVGTLLGNRGRAELEELIGPLANTTLIKLDMSGNPSFRDVLAQVKMEVIDALENQETSYEWAVAETAQTTTGGLIRLPGMMFIMQENAESELEFGGLKAVEETLELPLPGNDLTALVRQNGETYGGRIESGRRAFEDNLGRLAAGYERQIEVAVSDLDCRIGNLPSLVG